MKSLTSYILNETSNKMGTLILYGDRILAYYKSWNQALIIVEDGISEVGRKYDINFELEYEEDSDIAVYGSRSWSKEESDKYFGELSSYISNNSPDGFTPHYDYYAIV